MQSWPLTGTERAPELEAHAAREGAELLSRTIDPWLSRALPWLYAVDHRVLLGFLLVLTTAVMYREAGV